MLRQLIMAITLAAAACALTLVLVTPAVPAAYGRPDVSTTVAISEFRTPGPNPNSGTNEFIELYNLTDSPIDMSGWKISTSSNMGVTFTRATIVSGTVLPAHRHFLATNTNYSGTVTGDITYTVGSPTMAVSRY